MRSRWLNQYQLVDSASNFHNELRQIFVDSARYSRMKIFQEVPIIDLVPDYQYSNHHLDWYIDTLKLCIELHGAQHYKVVRFGGGIDEATMNYNRGRYRDSIKKNALLEAGYSYLEVPYTYQHHLSEVVLDELIRTAIEEEQ